MSSSASHLDRIARLKISLDDIRPAIWRRVEVPLTMSMKALHEVVQAVMLFENYHLFQFDIGPRGQETHYGIADPVGDLIEIIDARRAKLGKLIDAGVARLTYTYDFGDDWRHTILVETVTIADPAFDYPRLVDGANCAPPEDVGGLSGFERFIKVMTDPNHPEHGEARQWYGRAFDPTDIRRYEINVRIGKLAHRRLIGKAAYAKSRGNSN
jgi:hypothetical protein